MSERLDRIEATLERLAQSHERLDARRDRLDERLDRIAELTIATAANVVAHDQQIAGLLQAAAKQEAVIADLGRQWQAYLNTIHPRH